MYSTAVGKLVLTQQRALFLVEEEAEFVFGGKTNHRGREVRLPISLELKRSATR